MNGRTPACGGTPKIFRFAASLTFDIFALAFSFALLEAGVLVGKFTGSETNGFDGEPCTSDLMKARMVGWSVRERRGPKLES